MKKYSILILPLLPTLLLAMVYCKKEEPVNPATLSTLSVNNITTVSAQSGGNITSDGGGEIISRGVVWSTSPGPTVEQSNGLTMDGSGPGLFLSNITNLQSNTTYYVRAYATNEAGMVYGNDQQFTTMGTAPAVTTSPVTNITSDSATSGGNVTDEGGASITARGVVWSTSQNPTVETNLGITNDGSELGSFASTISGLTASTTYYVRAYATNSIGIDYGNEHQFTTSIPIQIPTVITTNITNITENFAMSGGNVTNDGGSVISVRGVVWSTSQNPTLTNNLGSTNNGSGSDSFVSNITGLSASTTYYVKAYATNSAGTGYGQQESFTTTSGSGDGTITDIDGNIYQTVIIGNQEWMAENLRVTRDAKGNNITRYCYANNTTNCDLYGGLYTWYTVMNGAGSSNTNPSNVQGICPAGWHLPSDDEWTELFNYVIAQGFPDENIINGTGNALKSCRQVSSPLAGECNTQAHPRWDLHSTHYGTDFFGFSVLPAGIRYSNGGYNFIGEGSFFWSTTEESISKAEGKNLLYSLGIVTPFIGEKNIGFPIRCIKD